jgi:hypothetical protein
MEMPSKAIAWYLLAICFATGLLVALLVDLSRPQLSGMELVSGNTSVPEENWFPQRTFDLLGKEWPANGGIQAEQDPFESPAQAAELSKLASSAAETDSEPDPPPPATREISLIYRGFYRSSSGEPFVYVEVENITRVYRINGTLAPSWTITAANASELILEQDGETRMQFPFNKKKSLEVPIE